MPVSRSMYNDWSRAKQSQRDAQKQYKLVKLRKDGQPSKMADDTRLFGSREDAIKHAENIDSLNPGRDYRYHLHTGHEGTAGHHKAYIRVVNGRAEEVAEKSETIDELQKAIDEAAMAGVLMLRKSQMSFDFTAPNPHEGKKITRRTGLSNAEYAAAGNPEVHHVAYTRTNASGTVSNIAAKGAPKVEIKRVSSNEQNVSQRHVSYDIHVDGKYHSTHNDINDAMDHKAKLENASQPAAKEVKPNANAVHEHYPWGRLTKVEGKGVRAVLHPEHQEAIGKLQDGESTRFKDEQGIDWTAKRNGEHVELKAPSRVSGTALRVKHSDVAAQQPAAKQKVWGGTDSADGKFRFRDWESGEEVPNYEGEYTYFPKDGGKSQMHTWIDKETGERAHSALTKDEWYKKFGQAEKHQQLLDGVHKVGNDLLNNPMMAAHHGEIKTMLQQLKDNPHPKHAKAVASQMKDMVNASKPSKNAAKDLKAELESDDFGMTEKGGNGRVKMGKDGTVSVYDSTFYGSNDALANHVKKWSPGGRMHNYFKDKGYNIEVAGTDQDFQSKVFGTKQGRLGHVAVHLKVTKADAKSAAPAQETHEAVSSQMKDTVSASKHAEASEEAHKATMQAQNATRAASNWMGHKNAAELHYKAADAHDEAGNDEKYNEHIKRAEWHEKKVTELKP